MTCYIDNEQNWDEQTRIEIAVGETTASIESMEKYERLNDLYPGEFDEKLAENTKTAEIGMEWLRTHATDRAEKIEAQYERANDLGKAPISLEDILGPQTVSDLIEQVQREEELESA